MNSAKNKPLSHDRAQKIFNNMISFLRKKQLPISFSDDGKESFIQLLIDKRRETYEIIVERISQALSSIATKPEECQVVEYPNGRFYKNKNTEIYLLRITFRLLENSNICIKGILYRDKRFSA